jgi:uncharacterized membrane protein YedE/YeeE
MNHEDRAFVSRRNLLTRLSGAVSLLVVLFVVSLVALLGWIAYFVFDATFLGRRHALGGFGSRRRYRAAWCCSAGFWHSITGRRTTPKAKPSSTGFSW